MLTFLIGNHRSLFLSHPILDGLFLALEQRGEEGDCIIKKMGAGQTDGSGCVKPCCLQPLLKDGATFPLFEQEDIIAKFQFFEVNTLCNTNQIYYFLTP